MNRIIIEQNEIGTDGLTVLRGTRAEHILTFLHAKPGQFIKVGILDGKIGNAEIKNVEKDSVTLQPICREDSLEPWFDLIIALPRPRAIKRLWAQMTALGVRTFYLINAEKVEKSYFSSHALRENEYRPLLIDGLMQAGTTILPKVKVIDKFTKLWDELPITENRFLAHPAKILPPKIKKPEIDNLPLLAIGPDGGWTNLECEEFFKNNFQPISLGSRPLRTDTAAIALVASMIYQVSK